MKPAKGGKLLVLVISLQNVPLCMYECFILGKGTVWKGILHKRNMSNIPILVT